MKKYSLFGLVFVTVGSFIGAGFASGKEIATYFARHKLLGLLFAVVLCAVFYYFILKALTIGAHLKENHNNLYTSCFGRAGIFIKIIVVVACFIIIGAMIAGNASLLEMSFNAKVVDIINLAMLLLVGVIVSKGYQLVTKANIVMLPLIIVIMILVCLMFLKNKVFDWSLFNRDTSATLAFFNCVEYASFNLMTTTVFLIEIGKYYTPSQIKKASVISSVFLSLFICFISFTLIIGGELIDTELPFISMAFIVSKALGGWVSVVIFFALLTSLVSNTYTLSKYLNKIFKNNILCLAFILSMGFLISLFGFSFIVVNFYSTIGLFGLFFSISLASKKHIY